LVITKSLKEKIQVEASNKNMLKMPKIGVLPYVMYGGYDVYKTILGNQVTFYNQTHMIIISMGEKSMRHLETVSQGVKDRYFFTN
jgi:hypothetical protein